MGHARFKDHTTVSRVAVLGGGLIGSGWAAFFAAKGFEVCLYDPDPSAAARARRTIDNALVALEQLGTGDLSRKSHIRLSTELEAALDGAEFVQECAPDVLALKRALLGQADALLPPEVVIASSTSGLPMTGMQESSSHPQRMVVGHPFNPPYLVPLVEVLGGASTDIEAVEWAVSFYSHLGKVVLKLDTETPGFVANRLQEAVWREALHMVVANEASVEQIDAAMVHGPGLRWAIMGPCLTFHLGGGEGGIRHMLEHFSSALDEPWSRLKAPRLTDGLYDSMEAGCRRLAGGRDMDSLVRERDRKLIGLLRVLGSVPAAQ